MIVIMPVIGSFGNAEDATMIVIMSVAILIIYMMIVITVITFIIVIMIVILISFFYTFQLWCLGTLGNAEDAYHHCPYDHHDL